MAVDLDATELAEPVRTAENTALVLIDFQRDFCEAGGYADTIDDIGFAREVVPRTLRLLHAARERSLTIVHTREGYAPDLSDCSLQRRLRSARVGAPIGSVGPLGPLLTRGEFGHDFISELTPEESELVIDKPSYGAFTHTSLEPEGVWTVRGLAGRTRLPRTARYSCPHSNLIVEPGMLTILNCLTEHGTERTQQGGRISDAGSW